jgi:hypothetical protein
MFFYYCLGILGEIFVNTFYIGITYFITWISLLAFCLTLFRFKTRKYISQIVYISFSLTQVSVLLQVYKFHYLLAVIQPVCLLVCVWMIIRIKFVHSMMIVAIIYGFNLIMETVITITLRYFFKVNFEDMPFLLIIGGLIVLFNLTIVWILHSFRIGFSFVQPHYKQGFNFNGDGRKFLLLLICSFILMGLSSYTSYFHKSLMNYVNIAILILVGIIIRISYQRELAD